MGNQKKSEAAYLGCLQREEKKFGPAHPETLATVENLAIEYCNWNRYQESRVMYIRAFEGYKNIFGLENKSTSRAISALGNLYCKIGEHKNAENMYRQVVPIMKALYGDESHEATAAECSLGVACLEQDKIDEEEQIFERILPRYTHMRSPNDLRQRLVIKRELARTFSLHGKLDAAYDMAIQAFECCKEIRGRNSLYFQAVYERLGLVLLEKGNFDEAEKIFRQVIEFCESTSESENSDCRSPLHSAVGSLARTLQLQYQKIYNDLQPDLKRRQARLRSSTHHISHQLRCLTELAQKYGSSEPSIFWCLGQVLTRFVGETEARVAFQQQASREQGILRYTTRSCDGCCTDINTERFVCLQCFDIDFCKTCANQYKKGKLAIPNCKGHELFDVSLPPKLGFKRSIVYGEASGQEWLESLLAKYGGSE
jgi:tetratricopeptide (TPR) repeat protein